MKKLNKLLIPTVAIVSILSILLIPNFSAAYGPDFESTQFQIQANNEMQYQFLQQTRINISSAVDVEGQINCQSLQISNKEFELEIISADGDLNMNMTCTEEQAELGLLNGERLTTRNRNRVRYQEGFCINISCNSSQIQAQLKIRATNQNRLGNWAYYDEATEKWVTVPTSQKDGFLVANTDHFSVWTILIPVQDNILLYVGIGTTVGIIAAIAVVSVLYYKRR